jgi:uncharacterized membrane protein (GlpM family)
MRVYCISKIKPSLAPIFTLSNPFFVVAVARRPNTLLNTALFGIASFV